MNLLTLKLGCLIVSEPYSGISSFCHGPLGHGRGLLAVLFHYVLGGRVVDSKSLRGLLDSGILSLHDMNEAFSLLVLYLYVRSLSSDPLLSSLLAPLRQGRFIQLLDPLRLHGSSSIRCCFDVHNLWF